MTETFASCEVSISKTAIVLYHEPSHTTYIYVVRNGVLKRADIEKEDEDK